MKPYNILHYAIEIGTLKGLGYLMTNFFKEVTSMRILVDVQDHISSETWPAVINTIRQSLQAIDFPTMQVEILDPER